MKSGAFHLADWLSLAAAPAFGLMAILTASGEGGAQQMWCAPATHVSPLTGMVPMYVLMSAFHITPWLRLVSGGLALCFGRGSSPRTRH